MSTPEPSTSLPWHELPFMQNQFTNLVNGVLHWVTNRPGVDPEILFLHGVLRNWRSYYTILPRLKDRFTVACLDFRGHGLSTKQPDHYLVTDYVDDAVAVLRQFQKPCVVYGHSLGGMVALATAARVPNSVRSVILEDPPFATMGEDFVGTNLHRYFASVDRCMEAGSQQPTYDWFHEFSELIVGEQPNGQPIRIRDQRDELSRRFSSESLSQVDPTVLQPVVSGNWLTKFHLSELLLQVRCPATLLQADAQFGGMLTNRDVSAIQHALGDRCQVHRFPNVGHSIHWQADAEVLKIIQEVIACSV